MKPTTKVCHMILVDNNTLTQILIAPSSISYFKTCQSHEQKNKKCKRKRKYNVTFFSSIMVSSCLNLVWEALVAFSKVLGKVALLLAELMPKMDLVADFKWEDSKNRSNTREGENVTREKVRVWYFWNTWQHTIYLLSPRARHTYNAHAMKSCMALVWSNL
jgi:hypothetical protein